MPMQQQPQTGTGIFANLVNGINSIIDGIGSVAGNFFGTVNAVEQARNYFETGVPVYGTQLPGQVQVPILTPPATPAPGTGPVIDQIRNYDPAQTQAATGNEFVIGGISIRTEYLVIGAVAIIGVYLASR